MNVLDYAVAPDILAGAWTTVWLTATTFVLGLGLAMLIAAARSSRWRGLQWGCAGYVWLFRGTPLLVQLVILYTGLPQIGVRFGAVEAAIIGLTLNEAAYLSETVRSGMLAVHRGQREAAHALGLSRWSLAWDVVRPQAFRICLPNLGNSLNGLLKTSTLVSVISVEELLRRTQYAVQVTFDVLDGLVAAALWYLAMTTLITYGQRLLEHRLDRPYLMPVSAGRRP